MQIIIITSWVRAAPHPLKANPLTGLTPLGPFKSIQITPKKYKNKFDYFFSCAKGAAKGFCRPSWAILGKFGFLELFQNYTSPGGGQAANPKKYFEVTHRVQGEVHAKFGWNPFSSLGSKSKQTNKQTDRYLLYI